MKAEPEMFGAAVAAPEDATLGSSALSASRLERRTWSSFSPGSVAALDDLAPTSHGAVSRERRSASAAGRAIVGGIALVQVLWWAVLAYLALRLFVL